jgi:hypothetical protein
MFVKRVFHKHLYLRIRYWAIWEKEARVIVHGQAGKPREAYSSANLDRSAAYPTAVLPFVYALQRICLLHRDASGELFPTSLLFSSIAMHRILPDVPNVSQTHLCCLWVGLAEYALLFYVNYANK